MASFTLNTTSTTARTLTGSEIGLIGQNGALLVLGVDAINANGNSDLVINGTVASNFDCIDASGSNLELVVGSLGSILSTGNNGVYANVSVGTQVLNDGTVSGALVGVALYASDTLVSHNLTNTGTISGGSLGVYIEARGTASTIVNSGIISSNFTGVYGAYATDAVLELWNTGTISGSAYAFYANDDDGSGNSSDRVYNAGLMQGDVSLLSGDDLYDGRGGTLQGTVFGGDGNDTYIVDDAGIQLVELGGEGTDEVQALVSYALGGAFEVLTLLGAEDIDGTGNAKANTIAGNAGDNGLFGSDGNDIMAGGAGADFLDGGNDNDTLSGGEADDRLTGRRGGDTLNGGNGDDTLIGGLNADTLTGNSGDDRLIGGQGPDQMTGGSGQDTFAFKRIEDSPLGGGTDAILDFTPGQDRIDVSDLASDPFTVAIGGALSGTGPSARTTESGGNTIVFVDVNGTGGADMRIDLTGTTGVTEADFVL